ncbi:MAG TPA: AraC family transcriptional regulator [Moraxellaceae bacterium]|nr:AraC family transcriptional regulator [Moraxellaceae bacterium]
MFLWMTWQAMQRAGLDSAAIFASVNLPDEPPDPQARRENSTQQRFWRAAERISGDPDIGLHTGALMPPFRGQVMEYLFLSSPTFGEGLARALRYHRLLTDALSFTLRVEGNVAVLEGFAHPVRHYLECALCIFLQFWRHVTDGDFHASEIWLPYADGAAPADYERIYGCPVRLGMPHGAILFDAALLARPSPAAEPQLLAMHEALAAQRLADLERLDLVSRIERELGGLLEAGEVTLERVAERLGRNPRTLRHDLATAGTSFNDVVARYRERLARRLLARTQESMDQIVYLTGFSEQSAFTRAFKRWTGETPTDYRRRKQADRDGG